MIQKGVDRRPQWEMFGLNQQFLNLKFLEKGETIKLRSIMCLRESLPFKLFCRKAKDSINLLHMDNENDWRNPSIAPLTSSIQDLASLSFDGISCSRVVRAPTLSLIYAIFDSLFILSCLPISALLVESKIPAPWRKRMGGRQKKEP